MGGQYIMKRSLLHYVRCLKCLAGISVALVLAGNCQASVIASDSASDPAYSDGWQGLKGSIPEETGMDNGGTGFLPWSFDETFWEASASPYKEPHFIDTKPSSFNSLGAPAFALTNGNVAFNGYTTTAVRPFAVALTVGDQISVDVDNPVMQALEPSDNTGFIISLQTAKGNERFTFYTYQGFNDDQWTITDYSGSETTSEFTEETGSEGFRFAFMLVGEEQYQVTITPSSGSPLSFEGDLANPETGAITRIQFIIYGNGSGNGGDMPSGEREFYFNNLLIESSASQTLQKPGDCNQDGNLDISDAICFLGNLFQGLPAKLPCDGDNHGPGNVALLDANGDKNLDLSDVIWTLRFLFQGGGPPTLGNKCQPISGCPDNTAACTP
jgi:hypothetical protein